MADRKGYAMSREVEGGSSGAGDAAGNRGHAPAALREAELPVRERGGPPRAGAPELLPGEQGALGDASGGADRTGARCDSTVSTGAPEDRGAGQCGARRAGGEPATSPLSESDAFSVSDAFYEGLVGFLRDVDASGLTHDELEARLDVDGRQLCRQLLQDHLDLRATREMRASSVRDANGIVHRAVESDHRRTLETIFGEVTITRLAYRSKGAENLHLQDASLNLPAGRHSNGLSERCAIEAARGSYEEAKAAIERTTGVGLGKRQVEQLARRAACDVEGFYDRVTREPAEVTDALVITCDGKGIVMRPDALRPGTKKAAAQAKHKLKTRLSKGEKKDRKRMAELAVVYDCTPVTRGARDILARAEDGPKPEAPVARAKWCTASVASAASEVIKAAFDEAERRDPGHERPFVALVDGAKHQIDVIRTEANRRNITVTIICDVIHVLEYLWGAARCFYSETDPAGEAFVAEKALAVLEGKAGIVAGAIARKATTRGLAPEARKKADECASYLKSKAPYLGYPSALAKGWPIATGVIEGACAHLVRDRFDITGARWSLDGAEAMLKLRAVRTNGDWERYWQHHLAEEHARVHASRYLDGRIPAAA